MADGMMAMIASSAATPCSASTLPWSASLNSPSIASLQTTANRHGRTSEEEASPVRIMLQRCHVNALRTGVTADRESSAAPGSDFRPDHGSSVRALIPTLQQRPASADHPYS